MTPASTVATLAPSGLPGLDPAWSRVVRTGSGAWHVLDNAPQLHSEPVGTLLCVHGNPTWSYLWRTFVAAGTRATRPWRVIAVDQLDMGYSERTGRTHLLADRVRELGELTDALGLQGPVVSAGHDWGGSISLGWAVDHPELLAGVVLLNTAVYQPLGEHPPAALRPAMVPGLRHAATVSTTGFIDTTLALAHPRLTAPVREAFRAPYRTAARRAAVGDFVADIPATADHPSRPELERIAARVRELDVPALLAWGARDPVFSDRFLRDLRDRLPHADVHRYPTAGHLVAEDEDVAAGVLDWLDERVGGPPSVAPAVPREAVRLLGATLTERAGDDTPALVELHRETSRTVSWRALARRTEELARGLAAIGVTPGDRVAVLVPPGADLTAVLYACLRLGAVVVLADAGLGVAALSRAVKAAEPVAVIGIERALLAAKAFRWAPTLVAAGPVNRRVARAVGVRATLVELAERGAADSSPLAWPDPDAEAAVLFTSGSTGPAKGVVYTHRGLAAMRDAVASTYTISPERPFVAAFAPFALLGPALGATSASPDMDVTAPRTLTAAALAAAVRAVDGAVVFASPAALAGILATQHEASDDDRACLARVETLLSAGAPVPAELLQSVRDLLPGARLHTPYGMTEMLPVTDIELSQIVAAGDGPGVCVGVPAAGARVAISALDDEGRAVGAPASDAGVLGEILVAGPHLKARYDRLWFTQHASARDAGWHRTGDVGRIDEAGRLWVEGRLAHVVATDRGVITPVAPERLVDAVPGVARAALVGVGPRGTAQVVVVVEPEGKAPAGLAEPELAAGVRAALAGLPVPVAAVLVVPGLPTDLRHNSKIDRTHLAQWAAAVLSGRRAAL
ncbi:alpha/beta fold hydrolase [Cellulomonas edaphi]|uniref:Alpha/beta fold hydrolase n=1 Tax=Cellulomonas edaphi TaxID=3053468 RepID=A0ABT7S8S2_9CELL|nr:alpha/beta fold hydrolase [Cellulomons edaphi]MDM7832000.1 alpha/beta fold hydrolase [Cellulomons edaphi]